MNYYYYVVFSILGVIALAGIIYVLLAKNLRVKK
jgi:hypothetical protein